MPRGLWNGYANRESFTFEVWTANDRDLYEAILGYCRAWWAPSFTNQTLGTNIKLNVRTWVDQALKGEEIRNVGWGNLTPARVPRKTLLDMALDIGNLSNLNEEDIGESWRETLEGDD